MLDEKEGISDVTLYVLFIFYCIIHYDEICSCQFYYKIQCNVCSQ